MLFKKLNNIFFLVEAKVEVLGGMNIDPSEVEVQDMIGHGSSGTVYLATWRGFTVCAKKIKNTLMSGKKRIAFLQEVHMLRKLRHVNPLSKFYAQN